MSNSGKAIFVVRIIIIIVLWTFFLLFFGYPSLISFLEKKTIFIEDTRSFQKEDFPIISVSKFKNGQLLDEVVEEQCYNNVSQYDFSIRSLDIF